MLLNKLQLLQGSIKNSSDNADIDKCVGDFCSIIDEVVSPLFKRRISSVERVPNINAERKEIFL